MSSGAMDEQLSFLFSPVLPRARVDFLRLGSSLVPLRFTRKETARRYTLRLADDGSARVTVPRRGSMKEAREFVQRHLGWLEKQLQKREAQPVRSAEWGHGTEFLFRGDSVRVEVGNNPHQARFGDQIVQITGAGGNLRLVIERHLRKLAETELIPRTWAMASLHQVTLSRVVVRNQRSRWGSCSAKKTVSLNWRLIQTPAFVCDYIILHELMHLREMNHSRRFWRHVASIPLRGL